MLLLGVLQAQAAGDVSFGSFDLLETQVLTDNLATQVEFLSGGTFADYQHLQLRVTGRIQWGSTPTGGNFEVRMNDATSTYSHHLLRGNGSGVLSGTEAGPYFNRIPYNNTTTEFGSFVMDILDINDTNKNTTLRALGGSALSYSNWISLESTGWFSTAAISSIQVRSRAATIGSGSRFSLYGIKGSA